MPSQSKTPEKSSSKRPLDSTEEDSTEGKENSSSVDSSSEQSNPKKTKLAHEVAKTKRNITSKFSDDSNHAENGSTGIYSQKIKQRKSIVNDSPKRSVCKTVEVSDDSCIVLD